MDAYERMRKIGEGAFGKAILVKHKGTSKQYVVKEINVIRMSAKEKSDSRKETAVLAQLNHPNIVRYKESFEERGSLYIVMDFCAGGDLYTRINNQRGVLFHEDQVLDWFVQICLAMKHIHDRKILHRDIKSQNIFLESDGTVKIGDFGIAKVLNSTVELARTCIGTPYYLSPEIVENRPYNNKSDVWSLGCVLYELTTLKHAFEAGNMKNLILKIIRGSYPPVPSKYSYDLRGLIAQLFKRSPRDRPSINSILRKSFLQHKIGRFLSDKQIADEFSHTVMHGKKIAKALPLAPPASRPPSARKTPVPSPTPRKYDPAAVYAPVRKSKENRPGSAGGRVTPRASNDNKITPRGSNENRNAVPGHQDWEKRKQELLERERKRREEDLARRKKEAEKQREQALANKHKEFVEKQKMARINKAREEGWNSLIGSYGSDNGKKQDRKEEIKICDGRQAQPRVYDGKQGKDRGNYEKYNDYLEKLQRDKDYKPRMDVPQHNKNAGKYMNAPRPLPAPSPEPGGGPPNMARQANRNRYPSNPVNEREKIVNDYLQRKKEAEMNKARGHAQMFGHDPSVYQKKQQVMKPGNVAVNDKVKEEQEYLERLRHIRAQNYAERMALKGKNSNEEAEERKKKIEALRQQADDRAEKLKAELERKRKDLFDKDKKVDGQSKEKYNRLNSAKSNSRIENAWVEQEEIWHRPSSAMKPVTPVPVTGVLKAIGVDPPPAEPAKPPPVPMTGALRAIGVESPSEPVREKSEIQSQKEEILKNLNDKHRGKWGPPGDIAVEENEESISARPKWGGGSAGDQLKDLSLEETASQMEVTCARDQVVKFGDQEDKARKHWGKPGDTVLGILKTAPICSDTVTISSEKSTASDGVKSPPVTLPKAIPGVGATIVISRKELSGGTITIENSEAGSQESEAQKKTKESNENMDIENIELENDQVSSNVNANINSTQVIVVEKHSVDSIEETGVEEKTKSASNDGESVPSKSVSEISEPAVPKSIPLLLPKPVLLPKPEDSQLPFGDSKPLVEVKSQGKGELFEKVDKPCNEVTENDTKKEDVMYIEAADVNSSDDVEKCSSGVLLGITTGNFDIGDAEMIRTCSVPNLSEIGKSEVEGNISELARITRSHSLDLSIIKEETSIIEADISLDEKSETDKNRDDKSNIVQKQSEDDTTAKSASCDSANDKDSADDENEDDEDEEELMSVRETMQSLLLQESDDDARKSVSFRLSSGTEKSETDEEKSPERQLSGTVKREKPDKYENEEGDVIKEGSDSGRNSSEDADDEESASGSHPSSRNVSHTDCSEGDFPDVSLGEFLESDDDDDCCTEFGDAEEDDDELFGRLEETRAFLEKELGDKKFSEVYRAIQALQEDEDENVEVGAKIAIDLLGKTKEHLYVKIFHLVMADSAFTEDNL